VDVMLVLLIIFMVAAPLLTVGVPIDLPETQARALNSETQPITVSINEEGRIYLQETEIEIDEVVPKLQAIATTGYDERIYVRGDRTADYGTVMRVMARISAAGYRNLGLVTLQEQES
jgi:biopolymer transport protein TolR